MYVQSKSLSCIPSFELKPLGKGDALIVGLAGLFIAGGGLALLHLYGGVHLGPLSGIGVIGKPVAALLASGGVITLAILAASHFSLKAPPAPAQVQPSGPPPLKFTVTMAGETREVTEQQWIKARDRVQTVQRADREVERPSITLKPDAEIDPNVVPILWAYLTQDQLPAIPLEHVIAISIFAVQFGFHDLERKCALDLMADPSFKDFKGVQGGAGSAYTNFETVADGSQGCPDLVWACYSHLSQNAVNDIEPSESSSKAEVSRIDTLIATMRALAENGVSLELTQEARTIVINNVDTLTDATLESLQQLHELSSPREEYQTSVFNGIEGIVIRAGRDVSKLSFITPLKTLKVPRA